MEVGIMTRKGSAICLGLVVAGVPAPQTQWWIQV